jgi:hypothetical protein
VKQTQKKNQSSYRPIDAEAYKIMTTMNL